MMNQSEGLHRVLKFVAIMNLAYFGVEFAVAHYGGSVSLFADSVDFLEDASINFIILIGLRFSKVKRSRLGMVLAGILLVPGFAALWAAWGKLSMPTPPEPFSLTLTGFGALAVNLTCALVLVRFRKHTGSLVRAAFLSARNDVLANVSIIVAGLITVYSQSALPDLIVGIGIACINASAAKEVYRAARDEQREAKP